MIITRPSLILPDVPRIVLAGRPQMTSMLGIVGGGAAKKTYRYFRWDVTLNNGGALLIFQEAEIFDGGTNYPTAAMTAAALPTPFAASASSEAGAAPAWKAFDDVLTGGDTYWNADTTTGWLKLDVGSGNVFAPTSYTIRSYHTTPTSYAPKDWTFEGSNTGSFSGEEDVLDTQTGITWSTGQKKTFNI